jgi:ubiquinol-cytochrome c reductase iron-sulfur subunit
MTPLDPSRGALRIVTRLAGRLIALRAFGRAVAERPPAQPRVESDEDPTERTVPSDRRAEAAVAILLVLAALFGFGFTAVYVAAWHNTQLLGLAIGGALALLAAAFVVAGKLVVPQETEVEERGLLLKEDEVEEVADIVEQGGEGITRRKLLGGAAGLAGAGLLTATATPLASLGPDMDNFHKTPWRRGVRLVDDKGTPYFAADITAGSFYTALPEHGDPEAIGSGLLVVKLEPEYLHLPAGRRSWAPQGIVAYSKICPHAGCAISLYRYPTYQATSNGPAFTCPCHYSTFLPGEGGRVVFGPAGRSLPQLPLMIDAEGHLRAAHGFYEDVGPSWWSVRRSES